ncbi:MAG: hypothetical protein N2648_01570, partial [Aquificaceae bacterium]|nr:hypothetical protein [Aquificaceae bacterium]MCX7989316.1 hypothetical protein [Aquificaceae bacterium]MDW8033063.1 hypothetical protein [Aquificaceae bacterium]
MEVVMSYVKMKASEYATLTDLSLNTVKNRIRAGVLKGGKEEDGIWYVYLTQEELDYIRGARDSKEEKEKNLQANLENLKSTLEGSLIATYMSALMQKEQQKEQLLHELSSLYTLLAIREKEMEFLLRELERIKQRCSEKEEEEKRLKESLLESEEKIRKLQESLREKDYLLSQKELELQRVVLDKDKELLNKEMEISALRRELEKRKRGE